MTSATELNVTTKQWIVPALAVFVAILLAVLISFYAVKERQRRKNDVLTKTMEGLTAPEGQSGARVPAEVITSLTASSSNASTSEETVNSVTASD